MIAKVHSTIRVVTLTVSDPTPNSSDYFLEIEAHFAMRRGTPFIFSPKDWALMKKWFEDGIPLPVVIEAIDEVYRKNEESGRKKTISSLSYCRHSVKDLWEERRNLHVGDGEIVPEESSAAALEALAVDVESSELPGGLKATTAAAVRALVAEKTVPRIEEQLIAIEQQLFDAALAMLGGDEAEKLRQRVASSIRDGSKLDEKTRKRTEEANLRRLLRERFTLPRLTLFR